MNSSKKMFSGSPWLLDLLQKWINWTLMKEGMDSLQSIETWLRPMTDWILWLRPINILLSLFQCKQWGSNKRGDCCCCGLRAADSDLARISSLEKVTWIHHGYFLQISFVFLFNDKCLTGPYNQSTLKLLSSDIQRWIASLADFLIQLYTIYIWILFCVLTRNRALLDCIPDENGSWKWEVQNGNGAENGQILS